MNDAVHQLVHGYEHGHSLLAASTELNREDLDLVGRLSDLSGALGSELEISPYLSLYPLPSQRFFAVARTCPDESAPRSGCVLTHTILVPLSTWAIDRFPARFSAALRTPHRESLTEYRVPVTSIPTSEVRATSSEPLGDSFIQRYFGEGLAPIVWFGARNPESTAWCVIQALWPSLRARFACCTLALQPRTLSDRPFDVVFAPPSVYSRFGDFARDHVVGSRVSSKSAPTENWFRAWTGCVFSENPTEICTRVHRLASELEPYPTAIRKVLFFLELQGRADESPTAALGAFDLLEALAPQPSQARNEKYALTTTAIRAIKALRPHEQRELLYLLCRRLQEHSFIPGQELRAEIRNLVQRAVEDDPEPGINEAELLTARSAEATPALFVRGVAEAVMGLVASKSVTPSFLMKHEMLMEHLIASRPEIPAAMLRSAGPTERDQVTTAIIGWCRAEQASVVRPALRRTLLPEIMSTADAQLVEELLRDLEAEEVPQVCDLVESQNVFRSDPLPSLIARLIGERHPIQVREWSRTHPWRSYQVASMIAATYAASADGLSEFFAAEIANSANQSPLLAAYIERVSAFSPPSWLLSFLEVDARSWEILVSGMKDNMVAETVIRLVRGGLKRSPIARIGEASRILGGVSARDSNILRDYAVRQLLTDYCEALCEIERVKSWFEESWVNETLSHIRVDSVRAIFADQLRRSDGSWTRIWSVVENIPDEVAFRNESLVYETISSLLQTGSVQWTIAAADGWRQLLSKISRGDRARINLCGQALHFALEHRWLPLSGVVAEAFYPVHKVAMDDKSDRGSWFLWGFGGWDNAKDLRRSLVDSFLRSDWPPSHFVLAAREPWLLRKLCKRMLRQWKGHQFLETAYIGLKEIISPESQELGSVLFQILQNPETTDEWD